MAEGEEKAFSLCIFTIRLTKTGKRVSGCMIKSYKVIKERILRTRNIALY